MAGLAWALAAGCAAEIGDGLIGDEQDRSARPDAGPSATPPDAGPLPDTPTSPDATPPPPACIEGDARVVDPTTGNCTMYFAGEQTWAAAAAACDSLPGVTHLVTVTSAAENAVIAPLGGDIADVWMGGTDQATEGTWLWITAEPMTFDGWRAGEPNDGLDVIPTEDCMIMEVDNGGTWDDRDCSKLYGSYCERENR